ncbi:MAG: DUF1080 domain-containing protein [Candidatus Eisenbacteria bacterium]|nr:DUF1080 domain-containing protein [Candidatus Eisenbacteria bacterium]
MDARRTLSGRRSWTRAARAAHRMRSGFTLVEMMVVVLLIGIVSTGLYQVLNTSRGSYEQQKITLEMQQNARVAIESLADDFRHVSYGKDPTQPSIAYAGPDSVTFVADVMPAVPGAETISYSLSLDGDADTPNPYDTVLMKTVADSAGTVLVHEPQSYGIKYAGLSFRYFNGAGVELPNPAPHPELIGEVMIEVTAVEPQAHKRLGTYMEETLSTTIYPRNLPLTPARSRPSMPRIGTLAVPDCESVTIPWETPTTYTDGTPLPLADISHFTVFMGTDPDEMTLYCRVARTINEWTVTQLTGGEHYYLGVTCTSRSGVESHTSLAELDLTSPRYPEAPGGFAWQPNASGPGVRLSWSPVTAFTDGMPITTGLTYNVYRDASAGFVPTAGNRLASVPMNCVYVDSTLVDCDHFYYQVTAEACGNEGAASTELDISFPSAPGCIANLTLEATETGGEILVGWTGPTQRMDGSALDPEDIDKVRIFYGTIPYTRDDYVEVPGNAHSCLLGGLDDCTDYYINVGAIDQCGHLGQVCDYNEGNIRTAEPCNPEAPDPVGALFARAGLDRIDLSWPANKTDCDLAGYYLYYGSQAGGPYNGTGADQGPSPVFLSGAVITYDDSCHASLTGLDPCADYRLIVRSADRCDPANQSTYSPEAAVQTDCAPCAVEAGCASYMATGSTNADVRLELYPSAGAAITVTSMSAEWTGSRLAREVWVGRPLVKIWDSNGSAGQDGNVGPQPSGATLNFTDFTLPATATSPYGLPFRLTFDGDQRYQDLELSFTTASGACPIATRDVGNGSYYDDFDDGNYTGWTVISGIWAVSSYTLYQSRETSTRLIIAPGEHSSFSYEAKVKVTYGSSPYLIFRYQDTNNYYTFGITTTTDKVRFGRFQGGSMINTAEANYATANNQWYTLRVDVIGNTMRGFVNCEQVLEVTDAAMVSTGEVGLRCYATRAYFDDVRVAALTTWP